jgi:hypothetical protein
MPFLGGIEMSGFFFMGLNLGWTPYQWLGWMALKYNQTEARIDGTIGAFQRGKGDTQGGELVEVLPRHSQKVVLRLSPLDRTVPSRILKHWLRASRWRRPPASSKSEFVMEPCGLSAITNQEKMKSGHRCRHTRGCVEVKPKLGARWGPGNQMPPAPSLKALWCSLATGERGEISAIRVGWVLIFSCIHWKSSRAWWTPFLWKTNFGSGKKLFLSADQINLYFIQIIVNIRQFCGIDKKKSFFLINVSTKLYP